MSSQKALLNPCLKAEPLVHPAPRTEAEKTSQARQARLQVGKAPLSKHDNSPAAQTRCHDPPQAHRASKFRLCLRLGCLFSFPLLNYGQIRLEQTLLVLLWPVYQELHESLSFLFL